MSREPHESQPPDEGPQDSFPDPPSLRRARVWSELEIEMLRREVRRLKRYERVARLCWQSWKLGHPYGIDQALADYETLRMGG